MDQSEKDKINSTKNRRVVGDCECGGTLIEFTIPEEVQEGFGEDDTIVLPEFKYKECTNASRLKRTGKIDFDSILAFPGVKRQGISFTRRPKEERCTYKDPELKKAKLRNLEIANSKLELRKKRKRETRGNR